LYSLGGYSCDYAYVIIVDWLDQTIGVLIL
jgi:hypothetical protein